MYHQPMNTETNMWGATSSHVRQFNVTYLSTLDWRRMEFVSKLNIR